MADEKETWWGKDLPVGRIPSENLSRLEQARRFIQFRVEDAESLQEITEERFTLTPNQIRKDVEGLKALEWLANETPKGVSLTEIVQWDANYVINSGTDELKYPNRAEQEARMWLLEFAEFVREILGEQAPHRTYPKPAIKTRQYFFPERD
jgi:hypothetical protein